MNTEQTSENIFMDIVLMYRNIPLRKSSLFYKFYIKIKISLLKKFDRANPVVTVDKTDYLGKMENLDDTHKFEKINLKNDVILIFAVNQGKRFDNTLKRLGTRPAIMYGLC